MINFPEIGFKQRSRKCIKKFFDETSNSIKTEDMSNFDWLCDNLSQSPQEKYQIQTCNDQKCRIYTEWSDWTTCSKICGGFRSRQRSCARNTLNLCNENYLNDVQACSLLDDCKSTIISKFMRKAPRYSLN